MSRPSWWAAFAVLIIGPACLIGPYVALKGGLGTKPSIARLLGTAPVAAMAVNRQRPLDPHQTPPKRTVQAAKAVFEAIRDAVTIPLFPFVLVGLVGHKDYGKRRGPGCSWRPSAWPRSWPSGGSTRPGATAPAACLDSGSAAVSRRGRRRRSDDRRDRCPRLPPHPERGAAPRPVAWVVVLGGLAVVYAPQRWLRSIKALAPIAPPACGSAAAFRPMRVWST